MRLFRSTYSRTILTKRRTKGIINTVTAVTKAVVRVVTKAPVSDPIILYYIRIEKGGKRAYKIGITKQSVRQRFGNDFHYVTLLKEKRYTDKKKALREETRIMKLHSDSLYVGPKLIKSGHTEMFDRDVLGLDL